MNVGENIRRIRKSKNMTMKELGAKIGITEQGIGNYERGDRNPNLDILNKISDALCISFDELFTDTKRTFSSKLIAAVSEMNYVYLSGDFSVPSGFDKISQHLEIISKETNISSDSLRRCIDENTELMPDEQMKLIHFWFNFRSSEDGTDFEYFINSNHRYIITHADISKEIKTIFKKEPAKDAFEKMLDLLDQNGFEVSISSKDGKSVITVADEKAEITTSLESDFSAAYDNIISRINSYSKFIIEEELKNIQDKSSSKK